MREVPFTKIGPRKFCKPNTTKTALLIVCKNPDVQMRLFSTQLSEIRVDILKININIKPPHVDLYEAQINRALLNETKKTRILENISPRKHES